MAKQSGPVLLEGTFGNLTCYRMEGQYYVRRRSSLTSKKFWNHKSFEGSRKSCSRFGEGNQLASKVYRLIEEEKRDYKLFCFLKKKAITLLKEGRPVEEAEVVLKDYLVEFGLFPRAEDDRQKPVMKFVQYRDQEHRNNSTGSGSSKRSGVQGIWFSMLLGSGIRIRYHHGCL